MLSLDTYDDIMAREVPQPECWVARAPLADMLTPLIGDGDHQLSQRRLAETAEMTPRALRKILTGNNSSAFVPLGTADRLLSATGHGDLLADLDTFAKA